VVIRDLVRNALRMRPDRIIVGEVRGSETIDMLQAMNTGHEGSLSTVHANSPRDALRRVETMVLLGGTELPLRAVREQVASSLDVIVHLVRDAFGRRYVSRITEVVGMEGDLISTADLFVRDKKEPASGVSLPALVTTGLASIRLESRHSMVAR
jgi:pilus assembly protein CpaF